MTKKGKGKGKESAHSEDRTGNGIGRREGEIEIGGKFARMRALEALSHLAMACDAGMLSCWNEGSGFPCAECVRYVCREIAQPFDHGM